MPELSTRQRNKKAIVEAMGGKCHDCKKVYPYFIFELDHVDRSTKSFTFGAEGRSYSLERQLEEAKKCHLVDPVCHAYRTHREHCAGCDGCVNPHHKNPTPK
jgi:hypothetical protein